MSVISRGVYRASSQDFSTSKNGNVLLSYWYHMFGPQTGNIFVDVFTNNAWVQGIDVIRGQQHSDDTEPWLKRNVVLNRFVGSSDIRIRFRAETGYQGNPGDGRGGDIGIDDIEILDRAQIDAAAFSLIDPGSDCALTASERFRIRIQNLGTQDILNLNLGYQITFTPYGGKPVVLPVVRDSSIGQTIVPLAYFDFSFQNIDMSQPGKYFIKCAGAQGGGQGGNGGIAWGTVSLSAGDVLYCRVGQKGLNGGQSTTSTTPLSDPESTNLVNDTTNSNNIPGGGFGDGRGGDGGGPSTGNTCSGGGASAVRLNTDAVANRIIVAGGGGGGYVEGSRFDQSSGTNTGFGGDGGGYYGGIADRVTEGSASRAGGGSQTGGGFTGSGGNTGTQTQGGNGPANDGGGAGGGYWGGSTATNTPAGGGSGYVGGMNSSNRGMSTGGNAGDGYIFIRKVG